MSAEAHAIVAEQYQQLNEVILLALAEQGIRFLRRSGWNERSANGSANTSTARWCRC